MNQLCSLAIRVAKTIYVGDLEGPVSKTGSIGLGKLDCTRCDDTEKAYRGCRRGANDLRTPQTWEHTIDYHHPARPSVDKMDYCPRSIPGIDRLSREVFRGLTILRRGVTEHYGCSWSKLPLRVTSFLEAADAAESRLSAQREDLASRLAKKPSKPKR